MSEQLRADAKAAAYGNVDGADDRTVMLAVLGCAMAWDGQARIVGNVRAVDIARALINLLARPTAVSQAPEGWQTVPVEPTEEMLAASKAASAEVLFSSSVAMEPEEMATASHVASYSAMLKATAVPPEQPVAWQWSDFSGQWYTVDTARMAPPEQEELARACAKDHEGRVRPLYASPPIEQPMAIKPLEWHEYPTITHDYGRGTCEANSVTGGYSIWDCSLRKEVSTGEWLRYYCRDLSRSFATQAEAKAAAQADYEARIRSALASPPIEAREAAIEECVRVVANLPCDVLPDHGYGKGYRNALIDATTAIRALTGDQQHG